MKLLAIATLLAGALALAQGRNLRAEDDIIVLPPISYPASTSGGDVIVLPPVIFTDTPIYTPPVQTTAAPTETVAPTTKVPVQSTAPAQTTPAPTTKVPAQSTVPAQTTTKVPVQSTAAPTTKVPVQSTAPVQTSTPPKQKTNRVLRADDDVIVLPPVIYTDQPLPSFFPFPWPTTAKATTAPVKTTVPVQSSAAPTTKVPVQSTAPAQTTTKVPAQTTKVPVQSTAPAQTTIKVPTTTPPKQKN